MDLNNHSKNIDLGLKILQLKFLVKNK